jgi:hypothetical protein
MSGRPRDRQRGKVYAWEDLYYRGGVKDGGMTLTQCEQIARRVTGYVKMMCVRVKDGRGARRAYSHGGWISLPRWARQRAIVLHEMAHEIAPKVFPDRLPIESHGREFVGCYMWLLERYDEREAAAMAARANRMAIDFESVATVKERVNMRRRSRR